MKRKIFILIIIACFTAVSFGQRRSRTTVQKIIQLTKPSTTGGKSFQEALAGLRPTDMFNGQIIDKNVVGQLAWAGLGNRITPSATSVTPNPLESPFPTQIFVASNDGVFYYQPINHSLEQIAEGDVRLTLANATPMPASVSSAGCVMLITSNVTSRNSTAARGGSSANLRAAMLLEAGHIAQNIQLQAACLDGYGSLAINEFETSNVARICNLPRGIEVLYIVCVGFKAQQNGNSASGAVAKRAVIVVPSENFQPQEFWQTKNILESAKIYVTVISNRVGPIVGLDGSMFEVMQPANTIRAENFDAVVVIGGPGASMFNNDLFLRDLLRDASQRRKIIGATSYGAVLLAGAGVVNGIKVACPVELSTEITRMGAVYSNALVEEQMRVITCAAPQGATAFATALADGILGR